MSFKISRLVIYWKMNLKKTSAEAETQYRGDVRTTS